MVSDPDGSRIFRFLLFFHYGLFMQVSEVSLFAPGALIYLYSPSSAIGTFRDQFRLVFASLLAVSRTVTMETPSWGRLDPGVELHGFQLIVPGTVSFVLEGKEWVIILLARS